MTEPPVALEATRENFAQLVLENSRKGPVLVDFWAEWAGPSQRQMDLLLRLAREYRGRFLLVTVNTDKEKDIARDLGVKSLPSCKLFLHGRPVEHVHGMQTEADYRELIERHLIPLADKIQAAALKAWQAGEEEKAIQVLAEGAMAAPDNPAIPLLLAKLLVQAKRHADAHAVLTALPDTLSDEPEVRRLLTHLELILATQDAPDREALAGLIDRNPDDSEARIALASVCLVADDYTTALEQIAELMRRDPGYRNGLPRRALLELLEILGPDDERARRYRQILVSH
jgi:putative thioredoxin